MDSTGTQYISYRILDLDLGCHDIFNLACMACSPRQMVGSNRMVCSSMDGSYVAFNLPVIIIQLLWVITTGMIGML
jgi:hypothetical protein